MSNNSNNNTPTTTKEAALRYLEKGYCVIPCKNPEEPKRIDGESDEEFEKRRKSELDKRKAPALTWTPYETRLPTVDEVNNWFSFSANYNLALVCGDVSGGLIAFDIDGGTAKKMVLDKIPTLSEGLQKVIDVTMKTLTGSGGMHILFRVEGGRTDISQLTIWRDGKEHSEIKVQGNGHIVVAAPSRSPHNNGALYETNGKDPAGITKEQLNELIQSVGKPELVNKKLSIIDPAARQEEDDYSRPSSSTTNSSNNLLLTEIEETRTLTDEQMQQLLQEVIPCYTPGGRNEIMYCLPGVMRKEGLRLETAERFATLLSNEAGDTSEELLRSLDKVDRTYSQQPIDELNGKKGLYEYLSSAFGQEGRERYTRICQIINNPDYFLRNTLVEAVKEEKSKENGGGGGDNNNNNNGGGGSASAPAAGVGEGETDAETKIRGLAETLERRYHFAAMEDTGELFYYNEANGLYEPALRLVKSECEKQYPGVITSTVTNVFEKLARRHQVKRLDFDADILVLNMVNGLYDLRTNTLKRHTWEYLSRKQLPVKYDPKARPKRFPKFLAEVLYRNQIRTAVEAMAYTLLRDNPFELYFILLGFGNNGKSVLMHTLTKIHGEDNVSHTSLALLLSNRFAKQDLEGMSVNIDMEMSHATIDDMSVLKELTGSEKIRVEAKFHPAYTTRLWAKHFFSTNEMPEIKDTTDAHYRREVILTFPNQFIEGENADPNLKHELTTDEELSGIFNMLVIPLRRIAVDHKPPYMDAKTIQERRIKHQLVSDPVKTFLETAIESSVDDGSTYIMGDTDITKEDLYEGYKQFCAFYKIPWLKYEGFCKDVKKKGNLQDGRQSSGDRKHTWKNIRLKKSLFEDPLTI